MNKEGIEIMADLNNHVMLLEQENKELKELADMLGDRANEYGGYLEKADDEIEKLKETLENCNMMLGDAMDSNKELKEINERVKFENAMHVKELLKLKRKIIGDGLEYLLESPDLVFSKEDDD